MFEKQAPQSTHHATFQVHPPSDGLVKEILLESKNRKDKKILTK
jgi:hypothetical protein